MPNPLDTTVKPSFGTGHIAKTPHFHAGRPDQPLACPLTADGVPIYEGMKVWDRNGDEGTIEQVWSETFVDHGGNTRVLVGVIPHCRWANCFSSIEAAEKAKESPP